MFTQNQKQVITKKAEIMSSITEGKDDKPNWSLSFGVYPGILFGMRTYEEDKQTAYVFYLPFIDVAYEVFK